MSKSWLSRRATTPPAANDQLQDNGAAAEVDSRLSDQLEILTPSASAELK